MAEVRIVNRTGRELGYVSYKMGHVVSVSIVNSDDVVSVRNVRLDIVEDDAGDFAARRKSKLSADWER